MCRLPEDSDEGVETQMSVKRVLAHEKRNRNPGNSEARDSHGFSGETPMCRKKPRAADSHLPRDWLRFPISRKK
jgi:hypothetical protein